MPSEITDPEYVDAASTAVSLVALEVANQAARLALTLGAAAGKAIKELDTGATWMLKAGGSPASTGDWVQLAAPTTSLAYAAITGKPATFPATAHTHPNADLTELAASLAGKAAAAHTHPNADLAELAASLAGKAAVSHTHPIANITGLEDELAALLPPHLELLAAPVNGIMTLQSNGVSLIEAIGSTAMPQLRQRGTWNGRPIFTSDGASSFDAVEPYGWFVRWELPEGETVGVWYIIYLEIDGGGSSQSGFASNIVSNAALPPLTGWRDPSEMVGTGVPVLQLATSVVGTPGVLGQTASFPGGLATCIGTTPNTWFVHLQSTPILQLNSPPINSTGSVIISGVSTPGGANGEYPVAGMTGVRNFYQLGTYRIISSAGRWSFASTSGLLVYFYSDENVSRPDLVREWTADAGEGGFTVEATGTPGIPGQLATFPGGMATCISDSPNTWFRHLPPESVMEL